MTETRRFLNVWDALEDTAHDAANMKSRSYLIMAIREVVETWALTQAQASARAGITQPRLNDLLKGRIDRFSLDALVVLADNVGLNVELSVNRKAA
jgi:predicted XRE-type DNA-binding protein